MLAGTLPVAGGGPVRLGPVCALCHAPAALYCRQDDAFLCGTCDVHVHGSNTQQTHHERVPTPNLWVDATLAPSRSDTSSTACLSSPATALDEQLRRAGAALHCVPLAAAGQATTGRRISPFSFNANEALQPPPPLPVGHASCSWGAHPQPQYPTTHLFSAAVPPPVTSGSSLDDELLECLEGLCQDPLAPLDFGYDLAVLHTAPTSTAADLAAELGQLDSCMDCATPVEPTDAPACACGPAASEGGMQRSCATHAATNAAGNADSMLPALSSDCSTISRPGSSQLSGMPITGGSLAHAAAAAEASTLWRQYRPTGEQQVVVEELSPAAAVQQRKRAADSAPEGPAPPHARLKSAAEAAHAQQSQGQLLSRQWAGAFGGGSVVTTGVGGRSAAAAAAAAPGAAITPGTPTSDDAGLAAGGGSFIWQHPPQGSLTSAGGSAILSSGGSGMLPGRTASGGGGAVTTGAAEAFAALQRHAGGKREQPLKLTIRVPPAAVTSAGAAGGAAPAAAGSSGDKTPAGGCTPAVGASSRAARTPRQPATARRTPHTAAPAASGAPADSQQGVTPSGNGSGSGRTLPPIPPYREGESRADKLARYRAKRERRRFQKTVRYECRKHYADLRPRIKGRFVSPEEFAAWQESQGQQKQQQQHAEGGCTAGAAAASSPPAALPPCTVAAC